MSARQWQARGVSPPLMRSLIRSGQLIRMRQGVYATKRAVDWAGADPVRAHVLQRAGRHGHRRRRTRSPATTRPPCSTV